MSYISYYKSKNDGLSIDNKFVKFMDNIEKRVYSRLKLYLLDLPDEDYHMFYKNGYTTKEIADLVIRNNQL